MEHGHTNSLELKLKYKAYFDRVQDFVNEFDPCGFIYSGAPIDEYHCLTNQLLSSIYNSKTRTEIKELILHEIEHHFGTPDLEILDVMNIFNGFLEMIITNAEKNSLKISPTLQKIKQQQAN